MNTLQNSSKSTESITYTSLRHINSFVGLLASTKKAMTILAFSILVGVCGIVLGLVYVGIPIIFVSVVYVSILYADRKERLWKQFAVDNGWNVGPVATVLQVAPPTIAKNGHSPVISDVISGTFSDNTFNCFLYTYSVGSGKTTVVYKQTIIQIVLPKPLPSFLLDSNKTDALGSMPRNFVPISLEGDFDKSFSLYAPKEEITDVLSVISPDVMQTLIQKNAFQDIQSQEGNIWFMQHGDTRNQKQLAALFVAIEGLMPEFYHRLNTYKDTTASASSLNASNNEKKVPLNTTVGQVPVKKFKLHPEHVFYLILFTILVVMVVVFVFLKHLLLASRVLLNILGYKHYAVKAGYPKECKISLFLQSISIYTSQ